MNRKRKIIIIAVVAVIALAALGGFYFLKSNQKEEAIIYNNTIEGVGAFQSAGVENFTLSPIGDASQSHYMGSDNITQISVIKSASAINKTISDAEKVNDSGEGHAVYKNTANVGEYKGDVRYFSVLEDNGRFIFISTNDFNLTCMIVDSFEILN